MDGPEPEAEASGPAFASFLPILFFFWLDDDVAVVVVVDDSPSPLAKSAALPVFLSSPSSLLSKVDRVSRSGITCLYFPLDALYRVPSTRWRVLPFSNSIV